MVFAAYDRGDAAGSPRARVGRGWDDHAVEGAEHIEDRVRAIPPGWVRTYADIDPGLSLIHI